MRHFLLLTAAITAMPRAALAAQAPQLTARDSAFHALNRLAYGARPGEVDSVARFGVMRWIDRQLDPDRIDDKVLERREEAFKILALDREELAQRFVDAQRERQRMQRELGDSVRGAGRRPMREFRELAGE